MIRFVLLPGRLGFAPAVIRDVDQRLVTRFIIDGPATSVGPSLDPGRQYVVVVRVPGEPAVRVLFDGDASEVVVRRDLGGRRGRRRRALRRPAAHDLFHSNKGGDKGLGRPAGTAFASLWRFGEGHWERVARRRPLGRVNFRRERAVGRWLKVSWKGEPDSVVTALPPEVIRVLPRGFEPGGALPLEVVATDLFLTDLLAARASGDLEGALSLAVAAFRGKVLAPADAAVAALFLVEVGRTDLAPPSWWERLAAVSPPWLPDGQVASAWYLIEHGAADELVEERLGEALRWGPPMFTSGLRLLIDALQVMPGAGPGGAARRQLDAYADAAWWEAPLTTFRVRGGAGEPRGGVSGAHRGGD